MDNEQADKPQGDLYQYETDRTSEKLHFHSVWFNCWHLAFQEAAWVGYSIGLIYEDNAVFSNDLLGTAKILLRVMIIEKTLIFIVFLLSCLTIVGSANANSRSNQLYSVRLSKLVLVVSY